MKGISPWQKWRQLLSKDGLAVKNKQTRRQILLENDLIVRKKASVIVRRWSQHHKEGVSYGEKMVSPWQRSRQLWWEDGLTVRKKASVMVRRWSHRGKEGVSYGQKMISPWQRSRQLQSEDGLNVTKKASVTVRRWSHRCKGVSYGQKMVSPWQNKKASVTVKRWSHREKEGVSAGCGCSEQSGGAVVVGAACLVLHEIKLEVLGVAHERRVGQHAVVGEASREGYGRRQLGCPRVQGSKFKVQGFIELFAPGG